MNDYVARVAKGVKLLDENVPDWRTRIDPKTFDLGDYEFCILGQIFGDYIEGSDLLEISFGLPYGLDYYYADPAEGEALTKLWLEELKN